LKRSLVLALCLLAPPAGADGNRLFAAHCRSCHSLSPGEAPGPGPSLHGLSARPVGGDDAYAYSPVLAEARRRGERWTDERLARFLLDPDSLFPGQWMSATGVWKPEEARQLAAFLLHSGNH